MPDDAGGNAPTPAPTPANRGANPSVPGGVRTPVGGVSGPSRPSWPLALLAATCVVVIGAAVVGAAVAAGPVSTVTSSRFAADRACPPPPIGVVAPLVDGPPLSAVPVATVDEPTSLALVPGTDDGVLGERPGRVLAVRDGEVTREVALDLSDDTTDEGDGGLLALAYDPDERWLYAYRATARRDDVLTAHPVDARGRPEPGLGREILRVDHPPSQQHHGGSLAFGPDGLLYLGLGDGGGLGDPGEHAQDRGSLLGKVLRIDPTPGGDRPYEVPADNPFAGRPGWRSEIWGLGVRNPYRMSLDAETGDLWLGDVGQACWEELDRLTPDDAGANLGWDRLEAEADFERGDVLGRQLDPVLAHPHARGWCAIVAGYVPRGSPLPALDGWLLHTDYCAGRVLAWRDGELRDLGIEVDNPIALVPGPTGHPWLLTLDGPILEVRAITAGPQP